MTDFGTAEGTSVAPFSTGYAPFADTLSGNAPGSCYRVVRNTGGHTWSSSDWAGLDHTNPGTGAFMLMDGASSSGTAMLSYATAVVAGYLYRWSGWAMEVQASTYSMLDLSFRASGVQQGSSLSLTNNQTWNSFSFSYIAPASGVVTFSLNDNNTQWSGNDFGLDDLVLTATPPPAP